MKSYILKVSALLLAGTTLLTACHKDDNNNTSPSNNGGNNSGTCTNNGLAKFLKVGNKCVYDYSEVYSDDSVLTLEVTGQTSGGAYQYSISGGGQIFAQGGNTRNMKECNDWVSVSITGEPTTKTYKLNRALGDTWTVNNVNTYTVVAKNVTVSTPAGNFVCDKLTYYTAGAFNTDTIYYSNDIGEVKYDGLFDEFTLRSKNF